MYLYSASLTQDFIESTFTKASINSITSSVKSILSILRFFGFLLFWGKHNKYLWLVKTLTPELWIPADPPELLNRTITKRDTVQGI